MGADGAREKKNSGDRGAGCGGVAAGPAGAAGGVLRDVGAAVRFGAVRQRGQRGGADHAAHPSAAAAGRCYCRGGIIRIRTLSADGAGQSYGLPATLGVSNAAVFGANLSIIALSGGFLSTGNNLTSYTAGADPFATSALAFVFAAGSVLVVLALCRLRDFSPNVVVLAGIALGSVDGGYHDFTVLRHGCGTFRRGDLELRRSGPRHVSGRLDHAGGDGGGIAVFTALAWRYNALLSGGDAAGSMGVNVALLRWVSLLLASLITAVCVSFLGMIGFVGIICPHAVKRLVGHDHRWALPAAALCGGALLLAADAMSRSIGSGSALPVGAITSLLGAPFFLTLIFGKKEGGVC